MGCLATKLIIILPITVIVIEELHGMTKNGQKLEILYIYHTDLALCLIQVNFFFLNMLFQGLS